MSPSARKALGCFALLIYLTAFIVGAVVLSDRLAQAPWWAKLLYFSAAGVIWAAPLKPLFVWMSKP